MKPRQLITTEYLETMINDLDTRLKRGWKGECTNPQNDLAVSMRWEKHLITLRNLTLEFLKDMRKEESEKSA